MAVFFSEKWEINRYFFFMDDDDKVCRDLKTFDMGDPFQLTHFLREFYNYAFYIGKGGALSPDMEQISKKIVGSIKKSFHTNDHLNTGDSDKRRSQRGGPGSKQYSAMDIRNVMTDALKGTCFQLQVDPKGFAPLHELPDHIAEAKDSNGK
ncbi:hypothetical protein SERLA73DRAFT_181654 [Serpula lacrymans var. lacrymans S7.3]|uniref:Uncharacterized protein n=2 Tax=Serpula lacrymans var. lacrymans TaxID=341189 RepID=F8PYG3_SERL3|nr:uncharacterized protein SERLADRAFT_467952 [Serpula lacrymans var. lacrymans S7.9]EGN98926.1 hypothetical protein SERLA73DRAFT_181654 [Serpula lacrymans var. lacrymans S7.3]EGO24514.1 hypothetical protein SERLADRAFT_467952 [Serpula lacrymans var. lacrymans S7.9]